MAVDKLVDSTQLDADLTSVANAIRTKGGTSADLAFPSGFVSAVQAIPSGGGGTDFKDLVEGTLTTVNDSTITQLRGNAFYRCGNLISVTFPEVTEMVAGGGINERQFNDCKNLVSANLPKLTKAGGYAFQSCRSLQTISMPSLTQISGDMFNGCSSLVNVVFPALGANGLVNNNILRSCTSLEVADFAYASGKIGGNNNFYGDTRLATLIFRNTAVLPLNSTNNFTNTPFDSGGSGGTIYIPKSLYDHLGDGTSLDYKAATNWSTVNGYGTITWAKIEGSIYETQYADGTPIT